MAKSDRGFASMDRDKQRAIASMGGRAAHAKGTAHQFDSEEGRAAGIIGGRARQRRLHEARTSPAVEARTVDHDDHDVARFEAEGGPAL